jgi:Trk K+ transport system NAD-binding subunit
MRIIVVGAGEVGYHVAERLANERHDVVVVDVDAEHVTDHLFVREPAAVRVEHRAQRLRAVTLRKAPCAASSTSRP